MRCVISIAVRVRWLPALKAGQLSEAVSHCGMPQQKRLKYRCKSCSCSEGPLPSVLAAPGGVTPLAWFYAKSPTVGFGDIVAVLGDVSKLRDDVSKVAGPSGRD